MAHKSYFDRSRQETRENKNNSATCKLAQQFHLLLHHGPGSLPLFVCACASLFPSALPLFVHVQVRRWSCTMSCFWGTPQQVENRFAAKSEFFEELSNLVWKVFVQQQSYSSSSNRFIEHDVWRTLLLNSNVKPARMSVKVFVFGLRLGLLLRRELWFRLSRNFDQLCCVVKLLLVKIQWSHSSSLRVTVLFLGWSGPSNASL